MRDLAKSRVRWIFLGLFLVPLILSGRLFQLQVIEGAAYKEKADNQYVTEVPNIFNRGSIFFQEKGGKLVSAATLASGYLIAINPSLIHDPEWLYGELTKYIPLEREDFLAKATKEDDPYEEIARKVLRDPAFAIRDAKIPGVSIHRERWRFYPGGNIASHILGFVGFNNNTLSGRYGLERYYENILAREDDGIYVNFFAELFTNITDSILRGGNAREGDLVLTIEPHVQYQLELKLAEVKEQWSSDSVGGIIIDPVTGKIYAMGAVPDFDPNFFEQERGGFAIFSNPNTERVYEMGSIVKPLTVASGLDAGVITPQTLFDDEGSITLNNRRIANFDGKARGIVTMQEALNQSLNTGMVFIMQKLGHDTFREYFLNFGVGEETGIDLPSEIHGLVQNLDSTRDVEYATASFGQGIAMTPISMTRSLSILANGGHMITPFVVDEIKYRGGFNKEVYPTRGKQVISRETSETITRMLVEVVDDALLGGTVKIDNYSVAAKTGTAQIADTIDGGYYTDRYLHSFFGYFPAYEPRFLVFLYNIHPKDVEFASQTLTHPFMDITKFLINYYEIPPDR